VQDVYNEYVQHMMSRHRVRRPSYNLQVSIQKFRDIEEMKGNKDFDQLKLRLHKLEVKVRVSLKEHDK